MFTSRSRASIRTSRTSSGRRSPAQFKRGRLDAFVRIDYKRENIKLDVNHNLIRAYVEMMSEMKSAYPVQGDLTLEMITRLPGLVTVSVKRPVR